MKTRFESVWRASGNEALLPTAFSYEYAHGISTDPSHLSEQRSLLLVNMLVILLSVSVVRSAYQSHLKRFSSDVGTLPPAEPPPSD